MAAETSQTLDRGVQVMQLLARHPEGLTVTEVAAALGINRTVVHRLVRTLEVHTLVRRDPRGRVHVGLGLLPLAAAVHPQLRGVAVPVLRELAERLGATAHLTIADGDEALALAVVEPSWTSFHVSYRVGSRHPLQRGAAGRAILLGDREPGYAVSSGELEEGAFGLAAPVRGIEGLRASVGIVTLGREVAEGDAVPVVREAAAAISARLR